MLAHLGVHMLITRITLLNHVEQATVPSDPNLLVHPLANQRCPGELCPEQFIGAERVTVRLRPVTSSFLFQLRVLTDTLASHKDIEIACRAVTPVIERITNDPTLAESLANWQVLAQSALVQAQVHQMLDAMTRMQAQMQPTSDLVD